MTNLRVAIIALLITLLALAGFGLNHELNRIKQSITELRKENQEIRDGNGITKVRLEWELAYQEVINQGELAVLKNQLLELQTLQQLQQRKNNDIEASIANLQSLSNKLQINIVDTRSLLAAATQNIAAEREQREDNIRQVQTELAKITSSIENDIQRLRAADEELRVTDEELRQQIAKDAKDAKELRIALESLKTEIKTEIESNANDFQNLRRDYLVVKDNILARLENDYARTTELEKMKKTVELFIEEIRILEDKKVSQNLSAPKRTNEVYPVLLLTSDDEEPTEAEKQEMLRSLAVARAWYNDKTGETFRFNQITIVKSARAAEWFKTCPLSQSRTQDEDGMLWECIQYELGDRRIPGLPRLWSNSVYFVFMPSFNSYYRGYGAFSNGSGLAIVGREAIQELNENSINRLTAIKTVTHELGHALGLNHIDDPSMLMYPKESADFPKIGLTPEDVETLAENPFLE